MEQVASRLAALLLMAAVMAGCGFTPGNQSTRSKAPATAPVYANGEFHTPQEFFAQRVQPSIEFCRDCHVPGGSGDVGPGKAFRLSADPAQDYDNYHASWAALGQGVEENRILVRTSTPDADSDNGLGRWPKGTASYNNSKILFTCWSSPAECEALLAREREADKALIAEVDCTAFDCAHTGGFTPPFQEPRVTQGGADATGADCELASDGVTPVCKPAAVHIALLEDDRIMYYNGLEGFEHLGVFQLLNDQSRVMTLKGNQASWVWPSPVDGLEYSGGKSGDSAWFCSDLAQLPDGNVLVAGGTDYLGEPDSGGAVGPLAGIRNVSLFDAISNLWRRITDMLLPRWYPTTIAMPDGKVVAFSGAAQVVFPVYPQRPLDSFRNEVRSETFDPATGEWTDNGRRADRSLPLYPRMHLLPNGHVFYNGGGEAWNPAGYAYDQLLWNAVALYDPAEQRWQELGFAGLPIDASEAADPVAAFGAGFRGSTFSLMMPLQPDGEGRYRKAEFLTAGGVLGAPLLVSPGSYYATRFSRIDTVDLSGERPKYSSRLTGSLHSPRWFGTGLLLPTGDAMVFSGSDRDEVLVPGRGNPVMVSERYNTASETWEPMARQARVRTYHNTALLLRDGSVLVGGHAPLARREGEPLHDSTFEIYKPPYMFRERPVIAEAPVNAMNGQSIRIASAQAAAIDNIMLVRRTSLTHVLDAEQRSIVLRELARTDNGVIVQVPDLNVVPPGPYMLFINVHDGEMLVPSVGHALRINPATS